MPIIRIKNLEQELSLNNSIIFPIDKITYFNNNAKYLSITDLKNWVVSGLTKFDGTSGTDGLDGITGSNGTSGSSGISTTGLTEAVTILNNSGNPMILYFVNGLYISGYTALVTTTTTRPPTTTTRPPTTTTTRPPTTTTTTRPPTTTTTTTILPTVTTATVTSISYTTAISNANVVTSAGSSLVTARGVCWGASLNPTIANSRTINGGGTGSFNSNLTGLTSNTPYHYRAYATNSSGTAYGADKTFTTLAITTSTTTIPPPTLPITFAFAGNNLSNKFVSTGGFSSGPTPNMGLTFDSGTATFGSGFGSWKLYFDGVLVATDSSNQFSMQISSDVITGPFVSHVLYVRLYDTLNRYAESNHVSMTSAGQTVPSLPVATCTGSYIINITGVDNSGSGLDVISVGVSGNDGIGETGTYQQASFNYIYFAGTHYGTESTSQTLIPGSGAYHSDTLVVGNSYFFDFFIYDNANNRRRYYFDQIV